MKNKSNLLKKSYDEFNEFSLMMKKNRLDTFSSSAAFYVFVSIIPFIILLLSLISYTPIADEDIYNVILTLIPANYAGFGHDIIRELTDDSITVVSISAISALWSAARGIQALKYGLNSIHGVLETKNFIILRLSAAFYTVLFMIYIFSIFIFNTISSKFLNYIFNTLGINTEKFESIVMLYDLRLLIMIPVTFLFVLISFWGLPHVKLTFRSQLPGAFFVSVLWLIFSKCFNIYISMFNAFSMYGSLAFVIVALLWLYFCMYIFFIGAQINYYLSIKRKEAKINS